MSRQKTEHNQPNTGFRLVKMFEVQNDLAEGIVWDERSQALFWTDIEQAKLYRAVDPFSTYEVFNLPERLGSFGLLEGDGEQIICAFETGFALYHYRSGKIQWLDKPDLPKGARFNDGRVDRRGYFWAGTMIEDKDLRATDGGQLFRYAGGQATAHLDGIQISNASCWSPDGNTQYFADTPRRVIKAYDVVDGLPTNEKVLVAADGGAEALDLPAFGAPDGACVDSEGYLWSARWGAGKVVRYSPEGKASMFLDLLVPNISCVCFAGPKLDLLCVTTARVELSDSQLKAAPLSGNVFVYQTPFTGLAENICTKL